jgi:hypothetical protein
MGGEMDLEEYQGLVWNYNDRQKQSNGIPEYKGPLPSEEEVESMMMLTASTVSRASKK